jgi:CheY-like chemotaxis protein
VSVKILIIDEDLALIKSLTRTFDYCGYQVIDAPDGMIGVQRALRHQPNLIISELEYPAGGAYTVLQNLSRSLITRDIPILIYTGSKDSAAKKRLLEYGVTTYTQKPCDRGDLLAQVVERLGTPTSQPRTSSTHPIIATGDFKPGARPSQTPTKKS